MYDLMIIGAGPAGLTAGIYAARRRLDFVILEGLIPGGQLAWAGLIENYPGFPGGVSGPELAGKMREQAEKAGARIISGQVTGLRKEGEGMFAVIAGEEYQAKTVIVASGSQPRKLNIPGETELVGKGVSYCAVCDGPFFRNRVVAVVGSGASVIQEALFLTRFATKVVLFHKGETLAVGPELKDKLLAESKVEVIGNSILLQITGADKVSGVQLKNLKTGSETSFPVDGVFIFAGFQPSTRFLPAGVKITDRGHIVTDETMETALTGLFAGGDCRAKALRPVVTACAEGALAVSSAQHYLEKL
ncbi:MAG: FAD-dependent oxidoreductase [Candidatus Omnitrophica bacterium]|nr:FAD-dependent oxidoreductase [Candidatus Omnitrophota bacterium]